MQRIIKGSRAMSVTRPLLSAALIASASLLASCSNVDSTPKPLTEKQSTVLAKQIKGKIAGEPINCIDRRNTDNLIRVSDNILLYKVSGRLVYKNELKGGGCPGLARDNDIIVTETFGGQYCEGDLVKLVDRTSGMQGPACVLGKFTPYRKTES